MIKFFRHIRKSLIEENNMGKYFKYAIGEILLVVIGILIALQINNWNEDRKNRAFERETLQQIQANLIKDKITLEAIFENFDQAVNSSKKILNSNWSQQENDSLSYWLSHVVQFDRFQPLTNAYEVAKSKGMDLISNKQLRFLIGTYYDDEAQHAIKSIEDIEFSFNHDWLPIMREEVSEMKYRSYITLKDKSLFKGDTKVTRILKMNQDNYQSGSKRIKIVIRAIDKIQELINKELNGK